MIADEKLTYYFAKSALISQENRAGLVSQQRGGGAVSVQVNLSAKRHWMLRAVKNRLGSYEERFRLGGGYRGTMGR